MLGRRVAAVGDWSDAELTELSERYGVSKEAVLAPRHPWGERAGATRHDPRTSCSEEQGRVTAGRPSPPQRVLPKPSRLPVDMDDLTTTTMRTFSTSALICRSLKDNLPQHSAGRRGVVRGSRRRPLHALSPESTQAGAKPGRERQAKPDFSLQVPRHRLPIRSGPNAFEAWDHSATGSSQSTIVQPRPRRRRSIRCRGRLSWDPVPSRRRKKERGDIARPHLGAHRSGTARTTREWLPRRAPFSRTHPRSSPCLAVERAGCGTTADIVPEYCAIIGQRVYDRLSLRPTRTDRRGHAEQDPAQRA